MCPLVMLVEVKVEGHDWWLSLFLLIPLLPSLPTPSKRLPSYRSYTILYPAIEFVLYQISQINTIKSIGSEVARLLHTNQGTFGEEIKH